MIRMPKLLLLLGLLAPAGGALAQTTPTTEAPKAVADSVALNPGPWGIDLTVGLGLSQSAFSDNWAGGDLGAFSWLSKLDAAAERQFSTRFNWRNILELRYGETSQQRRDEIDPALRHWDDPQKSSDMLMFESIGRWTLQAFADPYASFRAETQFLDQSSTLGSIPFNPIRLKEAAGIAKVFKKSETTELMRTRLFSSVSRQLTVDCGPPTADTVSDTLLMRRMVWPGKSASKSASGRSSVVRPVPSSSSRFSPKRLAREMSLVSS